MSYFVENGNDMEKTDLGHRFTLAELNNLMEGIPFEPKTASTSPAFTSSDTSFRISPVWMVPNNV